MKIGARGCGTAIGIDRDDRRAAPLAGLDHEAPEMAVGIDGVRTPVEKEIAISGGIGSARLPFAEGVFITDAAGGRADGSIELRRAQAMKEAPVEAVRLQLAHRAVIAVRQDRPRPVLRLRDRAKPLGDRGEGLLPSDSFESSRSFGTDAPQWVMKPCRSIHAIEISRHFLAKKSACEGMLLVAAEVDCLAVLDGDDHRARIRAIERTYAFDDRFAVTVHDVFSCSRRGRIVPRTQRWTESCHSRSVSSFLMVVQPNASSGVSGGSAELTRTFS